MRIGTIKEYTEIKENMLENELFIGKDLNGKEKVIDLYDTSNVLIVGGTGSGKSTTIASFKKQFEDKKSEVYYFTNYDGKSLLEIESVMDLIEKEIIVRGKKLNNYEGERLTSVKTFNRINKENTLKRVVLLLDGIDFNVFTKEMNNKFFRIVAKGRSLGITVVATIQENVRISPIFFHNFTYKMVGSNSDEKVIERIIGLHSMKRGNQQIERGYFITSDWDEIDIIRSPYVQ